MFYRHEINFRGVGGAERPINSEITIDMKGNLELRCGVVKYVDYQRLSTNGI